MTETPPKSNSSQDDRIAGKSSELAASAQDEGNASESKVRLSHSLAEIALYFPIGLASLAREAAERLLAEGTVRGETEVRRARNALENEIEIARSVGRARVRRILEDSTSRFDHPPLSILAETARAVAEKGRQVLQEAQGKAEGSAFLGIMRISGGTEKASQGGGQRDQLRGKGLASLKTAQRAAASKVLKARFNGVGNTTNSDNATLGSTDGEVLRVTFADDFNEEEVSQPLSTEVASGDSESLFNSTDSSTKLPPRPSSLTDYDSLSAQQIVARLGGLSEEELNAVLEYEKSTKSRAAVIERVCQELASRGSGDSGNSA